MVLSLGPMQNGPGPRIYWAHKLRDISVVLSHVVLFWRPSVRGAPSQDSFNLRVADGVGNRAGDILSVAFLGTLRELNATTLSF